MLQIKACFSSDGNRRQFQGFLLKGDPDSSQCVGVKEVNVAFPSSKSLLEVIDEALGILSNKKDGPPLDDRGTQVPSDCSNIPQALPVTHTASLRGRQPPKRTESLHTRVQCSLPYTDPLYTGTCTSSKRCIHTFFYRWVAPTHVGEKLLLDSRDSNDGP